MKKTKKQIIFDNFKNETYLFFGELKQKQKEVKMEIEDKYFIEVNIENKKFIRIYQYIIKDKIRYRITEIDISLDEEQVLYEDLLEIEVKIKIKELIEDSFCFVKMKSILDMINEETKKYFPCVKSLRLMETTEESREIC